MAKISLKQLNDDILNVLDITSIVKEEDITEYGKLISINTNKISTIDGSSLTILQKENMKLVHIGIGIVNIYDSVADSISIQCLKYGTGGGGSSADAELERDVIVNTTAGAINAGDKLFKGTTFTNFVEKLLIKEIAPTISFTATNTGTKEIGTVVNETTMTLTITSKNSGTPTKIKFYINNTLLNEQDYVDGTNSYSYTYLDGISGSATVKGVLEYKKSSGNAASVNGTKTFTFVYASYYGTTTSSVASITDSEVKSKTKTLLTAKGYTQSNITLNNSKIIYAYPKSYGSLSLIKDGNNFDVTASFERAEIAIEGISYYVYILKDPTTDSGIKMIYS